MFKPGMKQLTNEICLHIKVKSLTSNVAQGVRHHITLPRHRVWPLPENNSHLWARIIWATPGASWENEEEIWSPALTRGSPESRAVSV